jgi:predicted ThiF/HesA family dinucleotide-utilizing enzyme
VFLVLSAIVLGRRKSVVVVDEVYANDLLAVELGAKVGEDHVGAWVDVADFGTGKQMI